MSVGWLTLIVIAGGVVGFGVAAWLGWREQNYPPPYRDLDDVDLPEITSEGSSMRVLDDEQENP